MTMLSVVAESLKKDRQTDVAKLLVAFRNFANAVEILYATLSGTQQTAKVPIVLENSRGYDET
jgi:hypothetical protein